MGTATSSGCAQSSAVARSAKQVRTSIWAMAAVVCCRAGSRPVSSSSSASYRFFSRASAVARAQDLVFEGLQFGGDEALGGLDRLTPQVFCRHAIGLTAAHLDEKTLNSIEAELQARQAAAFAFPGLEIEQELFGIAAEHPQLIEFRIVSRRDHAAVAQEMRR
jgi:hypothetical protein